MRQHPVEQNQPAGRKRHGDDHVTAGYRRRVRVTDLIVAPAACMLTAVGAKRVMRSSIHRREWSSLYSRTEGNASEARPFARRASCACSRCRRSPRRRRANNLPAKQRTEGGRNAQSSGRLRGMRELILSCGLYYAETGRAMLHVATRRVQQRLLERKAPAGCFSDTTPAEADPHGDARGAPRRGLYHFDRQLL